MMRCIVFVYIDVDIEHTNIKREETQLGLSLFSFYNKTVLYYFYDK